MSIIVSIIFTLEISWTTVSSNTLIYKTFAPLEEIYPNVLRLVF